MKSYEWNLIELWYAQNNSEALKAFAESEACDEKHSDSNITPIDSAN